MAGWYKRWSRVILGIVGSLVAIAVNIDTGQVAHSLYLDAPLQQAVVATANAGTLCQGITAPASATACATQELETLQWPRSPSATPPSATLGAGTGERAGPGRTRPPTAGPPRKLLGWLITAFAVSFGAPFWFEGRCRGSARCATPAPSRPARRRAERVWRATPRSGG